MATDIVVVEGSDTNLIVNEADKSVIITCGAQGPQGSPGASGSTVIEVIAGEALGGGRAVVQKGEEAFYSDSNTIADINKVLGITTNAAVLGAIVNVQTGGELNDPSWNWNEGPIYNGLNGVLTQIAPITGFTLQVAVALSSTDILVNVHQGIIRS